MCLSCGCLRPADPHDDERNITLSGLFAAADAAGISVDEAASNIVETLDAAESDPAVRFQAAFGRPTIICDIDGVLAHYASAACEAVNSNFDAAYTPTDWSSYGGPFSGKEHAWLDEVRHGDGAFWASLAPDTEAIAALRVLAETHPTIVSSDRPASVRAATTAWLEYHGVTYDSLRLVGPGGKAEIVGQLVARGTPLLLVDDSPARWVDCSLPGVVIACPRRPWINQPANPQVVVYDSWGEIVRLLATWPDGSPHGALKTVRAIFPWEASVTKQYDAWENEERGPDGRWAGSGGGGSPPAPHVRLSEKAAEANAHSKLPSGTVGDASKIRWLGRSLGFAKASKMVKAGAGPAELRAEAEKAKEQAKATGRLARHNGRAEAFEASAKYLENHPKTAGAGLAGGYKPEPAAPKPAAAAAPRPEPSYDELLQMQSVPGPLGSSGGMWKHDPTTGRTYLVKPAKSPGHAFNEVATNRVYLAAGLAVPHTYTVQTAGPGSGHMIVSEKIEGLGKWTGAASQQQEARKGFGIDCLTSNWDVLGASADNAFVKDGGIVRVDQGGGGTFRAQGSPKPSFAVGAKWDEPTSMQHSIQGSKFYGPMTPAEAADALKAGSKLDLGKVAAEFEKAGIPKPQADNYIAVLKSRQGQIAAKAKEMTAGPGKGDGTLAKPIRSTNADAIKLGNLMWPPSMWGNPPFSAAKGLAEKCKGSNGFMSVPLRTGNVHNSQANPHALSDIQKMDAASVAGVTKEAMLVHRGVQGIGGPNGQLIGQYDLKPGALIYDAGFQSTSIGATAAFGSQKFQLHMTLPAGTRGVWIGGIGGYTHEREYLLGRGSHLEVTKVEQAANGRVHIYGIVRQPVDLPPIPTSPSSGVGISLPAVGHLPATTTKGGYAKSVKSPALTADERAMIDDFDAAVESGEIGDPPRGYDKDVAPLLVGYVDPVTGAFDSLVPEDHPGYPIR